MNGELGIPYFPAHVRRRFVLIHRIAEMLQKELIQELTQEGGGGIRKLVADLGRKLEWAHTII